MKKIRKLINKKACVSAIIGVILMVAITVAIAATVYVYVSDMGIHSNEQPEYISGNLTNIQHIEENAYFITLDNDSYVVGFDRYKDMYCSFTIGNFYVFRIESNGLAPLIVEINAIH